MRGKGGYRRNKIRKKEDWEKLAAMDNLEDMADNEVSEGFEAMDKDK